MAKCLNYESEIQQGEIVQSWHVSQSVDALTGADDYDITISGSLTLTGSAYLNPSKILSTGQEYVLTYNNTTGQIFKATTASIKEDNDWFKESNQLTSSLPILVKGTGEIVKLRADSVGGEPTISFYQLDERRSRIQHNNEGDALTLISENPSGDVSRLEFYTKTQSDVNPSMKMRITDDGRFLLNTSAIPTTTRFEIDNDGSNTNLTFTKNGKFGLGTYNPSSKFHVVGNGLFSNNLEVSNIILTTKLIAGPGHSGFWNKNNVNILGSNITADAANYTYVNNLNISGSLKDSSGDTGTSGQILSSTGTGLNWINNTDLGDYSPYITGSADTGILPTATTANNCTIIGNNSTIAGGTFNTSSGACSFIGGGQNNNIPTNGCLSFIGSGKNNSLSGTYGCSIIVGGFDNSNSGYTSVIVGGQSNSVSGYYSGILGGLGNDVLGYYSFIGGGQLNIAGGDNSIVVGGSNNSASAAHSTIVGGTLNTASEGRVFIGGGSSNSISGGYGSYGVIVGGNNNTLSDSYCGFIGGGSGNSLDGSNGGQVIVGGRNNTVIGGDAGILSGFNNCINSQNSSIVGGTLNTASADCSFIGGGRLNIAGGSHSIVVGGSNNSASAAHTTIVGGTLNTASAACSGILGGENNNACETESFIIGSNLVTTASCTTFVNNLNISGSLADSDGNLGGSGQILSSTGTGLNWIDNSGGGGGSSITIQDNGTSLTTALSLLNFVGATVTEPTEDNITVTVGSGLYELGGTNTSLQPVFNDNCVYSADSAIGSGFENKISGSGQSNSGSYIGSGYQNQITGSGFSRHFIGTGFQNQIKGNQNNFIGAGVENTIYANVATILNGSYNEIIRADGTQGSSWALIGGGEANRIQSDYNPSNIIGETILNGTGSVIDANGFNLIGNGKYNHITGSNVSSSAILAGEYNKLEHANSFILGSNITSSAEDTTYVNNLNISGSLADSDGDLGSAGQILSSTGTGLNWIDNSGGGGDGDYSPYITGSVATGILPTATTANNCTTIGNNSTIAGGTLNTGSGNCGFIGGGQCNTVSTNFHGFIGGGISNKVPGPRSAIVGGTLNTASAQESFIGGGSNNSISSYYYQSIVGGADNCIESSPCSIIGGGRYNTISSDYKPGNFIGGGDNNCIGIGEYNVIVGGSGNDIVVGQECGHNGILGGAGNFIPTGINKSFIVGSNITASTDCTTYVNNLYITGSTTANAVMNLSTRSTTPSPLTEGAIWNSGSAGAGCLYFSPNGTAICRIAFV